MHASTVAAGKPPHSSGSHIHDPISKLEEELSLQRLREEVSLIVQCVDINKRLLLKPVGFKLGVSDPMP